MDALSQMKMQKAVKDNADELQNTLKDLYQWQKEVKELEQKTKNQKVENEKLPPIRSHIEKESEKMFNESVQEKHQKTAELQTSKTEDEESKAEANTLKEKGNSFVKLGQYDDAIHCYTNAIACYSSDAVFYSNRALCYLKMEKFDECISDCDKALEIDDKAVKAYYRRMQANESLGLAHKALTDCSRILNIDPKNTEAKKAYERINQRIRRYDKSKSASSRFSKGKTEPTFSNITTNMKEISAVNKPAHLRSKKPLKRIEIDEIISNKHDESSNVQIPDEVIDKLFNSGDCGPFVEVKKPKSEAPTPTRVEELPKIVEEKSKTNLKTPKQPPPVSLITASNTTVPAKPPTSATQFYVNWKELSPEQKYLYLKSIEPSKVNKILGAGLDIETLSDVLKILAEFYTRDGLDVSETMTELSKHTQLGILSYFLSASDKTELRRIFDYMKNKGQDAKEIESIESRFNLK